MCHLATLICSSVTNGTNRILNAPVHLGAMVANVEQTESSSIWIQKAEENSVRSKF
jgi:hypothetical protein